WEPSIAHRCSRVSCTPQVRTTGGSTVHSDPRSVSGCRSCSDESQRGGRSPRANGICERTDRYIRSYFWECRSRLEHSSDYRVAMSRPARLFPWGRCSVSGQWQWRMLTRLSRPNRSMITHGKVYLLGELIHNACYLGHQLVVVNPRRRDGK